MSARIKRHLNLHIIDLLVPPGDWPAREVKSIFLSSISAAVRLRDETGISAGGPPDDPPDGLEGGCERENANTDPSTMARELELAPRPEQMAHSRDSTQLSDLMQLSGGNRTRQEKSSTL